MSKVFSFEDTRFFRFWGEVFPELPTPTAEFRFKNPVPIYTEDGSLVAWGVLDQDFGGSGLYCRAAGRADFPERLDIENGEKVYFRASYETRGVGPVIDINALYLSKKHGESHEFIRVFEFA